MKLHAAFAAFLLSFANLPAAQQPSPPAASSSSQATTLLTQSLASLTGRAALTDVTLSGTARRIAGSDDESGTVVIKALASGSSRIDLSFPSGPRSEIRSASADGPAGSWSGPDSVAHPIANHNLLSEPAWFFPAIVVAQGLSASGYIVTYIGNETHNSTAVEHISLSQQPSGSPKTVALLRHLSQVEIYLDSTTLLPAAMAFNIHPDNNALLAIPIEIRYSDYRTVNGAQVPFHVQRYLNNGLVFDFQAHSVALNTGLAASTFNAQ